MSFLMADRDVSHRRSQTRWNPSTRGFFSCSESEHESSLVLSQLGLHSSWRRSAADLSATSVQRSPDGGPCTRVPTRNTGLVLAQRGLISLCPSESDGSALSAAM